MKGLRILKDFSKFLTLTTISRSKICFKDIFYLNYKIFYGKVDILSNNKTISDYAQRLKNNENQSANI